MKDDPKISSSKLRFFWILTTSLSIFIVFLLAEVVLRIFKPQPIYARLKALVQTGTFLPDDIIPFTLKPNFHDKVPSMEYPGKFVEASTNSLGLRGKEIAIQKPLGTKRILILGDSYTYGVYVDDSETYSVLLEKLFQHDHQNVEVINAGYADGWDPDEHYAWLVNKGIKFKPDIIIYGFFIGNDIDPKNLVWSKKDQRGLPLQVSNPAIYVDGEGIIRSKNEDNKTVGSEGIYRVPLLRESHFCVFLYNHWEKMCSYLQNQKHHTWWGEDPFPFILKKQSDAVMLKEEERFKDLVKGMAEVAGENHAQFLLLMIPINFQVDPNFLKQVLGSDKFKIERNYFDELKPWLKKNNIQSLDLLPLMKGQPKERFFPKNGEVHFNPHGHRFTAEQLFISLKQVGWLKN